MHPKNNIVYFCFQGVIVLSRQWKNMLYNPMLFEHQYKNKLNRPINVTFAVPQDEVNYLRFFLRSVLNFIIQIFSHSKYQKCSKMPQNSLLGNQFFGIKVFFSKFLLLIRFSKSHNFNYPSIVFFLL